MKNFKFLSALALTGMLSAGIVGTTFAAETTKMLGEYKANELNNAKSSSVVALQLANSADRVTVDEIKELGKYTNVRATSGVAEVSTGDTIITNGNSEEKHVVVYGDVDGSKSIEINDVVYASDIYAGMPHEGQTEYNEEAANVHQASGKTIDLEDVVAISDLYAGLDNDYVKDVPVPSQTPEVKYDYSATVKDNGVINNRNVTAAKASVKTTEDLKSAKNVKLQIVKEDGTIVNLPDSKGTGNFVEHQTEIEVDMGNISTLGLDDGKYKLQVLDADNGNKVIGETPFEIHTKEKISLADSQTDRYATKEATLKAEAYGTSNAKKMYYVVTTSKNAPAKVVTPYNKIESETVNSIDFKDNKIDTVIKNLEYNSFYYIHYILEDEYGNLTEIDDNKEPIMISTDKAVTTATSIASVTAPDLTKYSDPAQASFVWTLATDPATGHETAATGKTFVVTLYRGDTPVSSVTVTGKASITVDDLKDIDGNVAMLEEGDYKLKVVTKGTTGTLLDSDPAESNTVSVKKVNQVKNIKFDIVEDEDANVLDKLSWESDYTKKQISGYDLKFVTVDSEGKETDAVGVSSTTADSSAKDVTLTGIQTNTVYKAKIVTKSNGTLAEIDSDEMVSDPFFKLDTVEVKEVYTNKAVLKMAKPLENEDKAKYTVEVYEVTGNSGTLEGQLKGPVATKSVTVDPATGEFTVDALTPNTRYAFKLLVDINGTKGTSNYTTKETTLKEMPKLENLTVVDNGSDTSGNKIAITGTNELTINGVEYDELTKYPKELQDVYDLIDSGNLKVDDVFTYTSEKLTITMLNRASERIFSDELAGKTLELAGNNLNKVINTKGSSVKEVILTATEKGKETLFNISNVEVAEGGRILLEDGIDVTAKANQKVVIAKGASVLLDKYTIKVGADTELYHSGINYTVTANNGYNELTINNPNGGVNLTLTGNGYAATQDGKINIEATGDVTVKGNVSTGGVSVSSDLTIKATNGSVHVEGTELEGEKDISITKKKDEDPNVVVYGRPATPFAYKLKNVELRKYDYANATDKGIIDTIVDKAGNQMIVDNVDVQDGVLTRSGIAKMEEFNKFLAAFGVNDKNAKITTASDAKVTKPVAEGAYVSITFEKSVTDVKVKNLK